MSSGLGTKSHVLARLAFARNAALLPDYFRCTLLSYSPVPPSLKKVRTLTVALCLLWIAFLNTTPSNSPSSPSDFAMAAAAPPNTASSPKLDAFVQKVTLKEPQKLSGVALYSRFVCCNSIQSLNVC